LENEPVIARPPSQVYRLRKLVQRNKIAFSGAVTVAVILAIGILVSTWQAIEAQQSKKAAVAERLKTEEQRQIAEKGETEFRHLHYVSTMNLVQRAWEEDNVPRVRALLDETKAYPDRGFEWYYWQRQCHQELLALHAGAGVWTVAVSSDGRFIATGDTAAVVKVWDATTGRELCVLKGHPEYVDERTNIWGTNVVTAFTGNVITSIAFSPDGKRLVTASFEHNVRVWEIPSGRPIMVLSGHTNWIESVAFSLDGSMIVSGGKDHTVRIWDAATGREQSVVDAHTWVYSVQFSPDSKRVVAAGIRGPVRIWDVSTRNELLHFQAGNSSIIGVTFSPDGKRIATASGDKSARIWNSSTGQELLAFRGHKDVLYSVAFSPDGKRLITSSGDLTPKIWDAVTGRELLSIKGHISEIRSAAFFSDGRRVVTGSLDGTAKVWDVDALGDTVSLRGPAGDIEAVAFSPDSQRILTGSKDGTVKVWDVATHSQLLNLTGHTGSVNSVTFSPDGGLVLTGGEDGTVRLWDATTGHEQLVVRDTNSISAVSFSPDGKRMAAADSETIAVWDISAGRQLVRFPANFDSEYISEWGEPIYERGHHFGLTFLPDRSNVVVGLHHGGAFHLSRTVSIWDASTGKQVLVIETNNLGQGLALSPDGQEIVTGSYDNTAILWNATNGTPLRTLAGHAGSVQAVAFSPDGKRVVTASDDQTAKIWESESGRELLTFRLSGSQALCLAVSPDGLRIAAGKTDHAVTIWEAASPSQVKVWQEQER
jgi:WD40 repeat protein